jgi:hypothetical protein
MPVIRLELPKREILMAYVMDAKWTGIARRGYFDGLCNRLGQVGITKRGNLMTYVMDSGGWGLPKKEI